MRKYLFYPLYFAAFTFVYVLSFHTPLFSGQKVLFYRGIWLLGFGALIMGLLGIGIRKRIKAISSETLIAALILSLSLNLVFFVVFPVTFDRSVTIYLLSTINATMDNPCELSESKLENKLIDEYVVKQKAVARRIYEQEQIGFIQAENTCINPTIKTKNFLKFASIINILYGLRK